jgi:hypothetical protein
MFNSQVPLRLGIEHSLAGSRQKDSPLNQRISNIERRISNVGVFSPAPANLLEDEMAFNPDDRPRRADASGIKGL